MSETPSKPLTLKGILALVGAGLLYLLSQVLGIDLTGSTRDQDTAGGNTSPPAVTAPADPASGDRPPIQLPAPEEDESDGGASEDELPDDTAKIRQLFNGMRSGVHVEAAGEVVHLLPDDTRGSQHQLFLCELSNGLTLKISHNIDIAPYIPLEKGDTVRFRGDYEYNDKGGVVHWTHRNTRGGSHPHGWILHEGKKYE